jgi:hypothetical protein
METKLPTGNPVARLNDAFRQTLLGGQVMITRGFANLPTDTQARIMLAVKEFSSFTKDNDPYGEHDFGKLHCDGHTIFCKIDTYDLSMKWASEDPADPAKTRQVLTVMLAQEY